MPPAAFHDPPMLALAREARRVILKGGSYLKGGLSSRKPVDTAAALARGSTTRPPLSQPWARALLGLGLGLANPNPNPNPNPYR